MLGKIKAIGNIQQGAERLQRYMKSVDDDLRALSTTFNDNMKIIGENFKELDTKLNQILKKL